jgi:hypothetical protein
MGERRLHPAAVDLLCAKHGDPEGGVLFFRWKGGAWTRIPGEAYPQNSKVNLLRNPWGRDTSEDAQGLIRHVALDERIANRATDACQAARLLLTSRIGVRARFL